MPEVDPQPAVADILMADEPVVTGARAVPTMPDLLVEAELIREESTRLESEQPATRPPTSEMPDLPEEMERDDDQPIAAELAMPLIMAAADKLIPEGSIEQEIPLEEVAQDENIQVKIAVDEPTFSANVPLLK